MNERHGSMHAQVRAEEDRLRDQMRASAWYRGLGYTFCAGTALFAGGLLVSAAIVVAAPERLGRTWTGWLVHSHCLLAAFYAARAARDLFTLVVDRSKRAAQSIERRSDAR